MRTIGLPGTLVRVAIGKGRVKTSGTHPRALASDPGHARHVPLDLVPPEPLHAGMSSPWPMGTGMPWHMMGGHTLT